MIVLGIESSCDETAIAVVENGRKVLSSVVSSQIEIHKLFGGVVPEIASRNHVLAINSVFEKALKDAKISIENIDLIAVTQGAGLLGALIVGVNFAKALSFATGKPIVGVNHIHAHICANYLTHEKLNPPFVCLVVSGGHTAILNVESFSKHRFVATTTDDALGEAFDKVARVCGLEYPGGPNVSRCAEKGKAEIEFVSKPKFSKNSFSYSGLKTAVINYLHKKSQNNESFEINDICASFEKEAIEQVAFKAIEVAKKSKSKKLTIAGGVSANKFLREKLAELCEKEKVELFVPDLKYCTDNAAMIASKGYFDFQSGKVSDLLFVPSATLPLWFFSQIKLGFSLFGVILEYTSFFLIFFIEIKIAIINIAPITPMAG